MVGAGSRYENKQNNGISHFLEHMFFKGTKRRPTFMEISGQIDGIGGMFNAFTGKEYTGYYIKGGVNNIEICLDLLSDMLQNSKLDEKEIEKEKGVIIEEINMYEDTPMRHIGDIYERLLYGDTPLGWDTAGEKEIIRSMTRDDFVSYMKSLYSPSNIAVVAAGGIDDAEIHSLTQKYFGKMEEFSTPTALPVVESQKVPGISLKHKKTEQAHMALGVRTVPLNSPEKYPLSVLAGILGGGMSSRLFSEVREQRGLAYYVSASSDQYTDAGSLVVTAGVDPKRAEESVEVILSELHSLRSGKKPVTAPELKKAKEYIKGRLVLALEDSQAVSVFYGTQELIEPKTLNPDEILAKIDKVTIEDINRVAENYFKSNLLNFAIIGDFEDKDKFEKLLKL
jgi:predicted Zn-dependent peptidase